MADNNTDFQMTHAKKSQGGMRKLGLLILSLVIVALLAAGGAGLFWWFAANHQMSVSVTSLKKSLEQTQAEMQTTQKALSDLQQENQQLNTALKTQADALDEVRKTQNAGKDDFVLAEIGYLLRVANQNLQFEHNVPLAIKLLNAADQQLANLPDPKLYVVREAISGDLATLQGASQIDVPGIYLKLAALNEQIDKLPFVSRFQAAQTASEAPAADASWWRRGLHNTWQTLQHVVTVRRHENNSLPFITPDQQAFLLQNLHAKVSEAQWSLLHQQNEIYRASLQQLSDWIKQYETQDVQAAQQVLGVIADLQMKNIQAPPINVDNSLQALQAYVKGK